MIRFTYVARVQDGLMLVASIDSGGATQGPQADQQKADGKQIIRSLNVRSPKQCTFESENVAFHYLLENNIVYLVLADKSYPKRVAFLYLAELHSKFLEHVQAEHGQEWEHALATVDRPYAFIQFDKQIQRLRKEFADPNSRHTMSKLNADLQDVNTIMRKNIQDVLDRGDRLNRTYEASSKLMNDSMKFHGGAKKLNRMAFIRKWAPVAIGVVLVLFFILIRMYVL
ncbi:Vesicle-trafficking protein SEC22b [Hondaea fermentalgiana]|uniref:Vesicle-trafficking protein SEC22b n=1 Tax=Hondaea fermentalgiana TaxID=2315210 RepID=A0A2R5GM07_9STRA|nr:Vesicle-trafficking protein SEC22b [Hondaea fermentalgiana]|eukprot:GBG29663.1 Vesicle-trafficking protein SEC22b [Hondaea fermentalgiana]